MQKKIWYYEKWGGRHASFPPRPSVKRKQEKICRFRICENISQRSYLPIERPNLKMAVRYIRVDVIFIVVH